MNLRRVLSWKGNLTWFFAFHFILPYIIAALAVIHLLFLHKTCSNKFTVISFNIDKILFFINTTQRYLGCLIPICNLTNTSAILTWSSRRPRQLHSNQLPQHTLSYQTRVIFLICICNSMINSQQTSLNLFNPNPSN